MSEREPVQPSSDSQREMLEEAVTTYELGLLVDDTAEAWLTARGLDEEIVRTARLGVVDDPMPGHEPYRGKLAIPYIVKGRPVTVRFRCLESHDCRELGHGKYLTVTGDTPRMYNTAAIFEATDEIHVTEGEFDALVLHQLGLPAVAIPGANNWASHHRRMLAGFSRVWVWGDPDTAGAEFVTRVCQSLRAARGVRLRHGDVTDTFLHGGKAAIFDAINRKA